MKQRYSDAMQHGKLRTDRGSWFINEFFLKLAFFNIHDTFKAGKWSSQVFLKLVYLTIHDIFNRVKWKCGKARTEGPVLFWNFRRVVDWTKQKTQNQIKMRITTEYGETRVIPTYRNGCKNSWRILWMTEFLKAETHTQVPLMDYL